MRKLKKNGKVIAFLLIIVVVLALAVYGLISIIGNFSKTNDNSSSSSKIVANGGESTKLPDPSVNPGISENSTELPIPVNKEILVSFSLNSLIIKNPRENYTFKNITGDDKLIVYISDSTCEELGFWEIESSDYADNYSVREEKDGILITININKPFTIHERKNEDEVILEIVAQLNTNVLEYRNDLSRVYMNIHKARLSQESDSFIKNYTEIFNEDSMVYTITIAKSKMPELKDETIILNDDLFKSIQIVNRSSDIQLIFSAYEKIVIYPNTRDYDAAFTFISKRIGEGTLIVLDPGHGGIDGGTTNADESILEKNIVLNMCAIITEKLLAKGYEVINLREEDIFLGLMERTDIANLAEADAIISVHVNSYIEEYVKGATSLYKTSEGLARAIQSGVVKETGAFDRGTIKMLDLSILNRAEMEAVIIETGFITNKEEELLLNTVEYQEKVATGIANGIINFFERN